MAPCAMMVFLFFFFLICSLCPTFRQQTPYNYKCHINSIGQLLVCYWIDRFLVVLMTLIQKKKKIGGCRQIKMFNMNTHGICKLIMGNPDESRSISIPKYDKELVFLLQQKTINSR